MKTYAGKIACAGLPDAPPVVIIIVALDREDINALARSRGEPFMRAWMTIALILDLHHPNPEWN